LLDRGCAAHDAERRGQVVQMGVASRPSITAQWRHLAAEWVWDFSDAASVRGPDS